MTDRDRNMTDSGDDMSLEEFIENLEQNEEIAEGKSRKGDDLYRMYLEEIKDIPKLGEGEQDRLLLAIAGGSPEEAQRAVKRLTEGKLPDALRIAKEYENQGLHINDIIQEASYGLLMAAGTYQGGDFDRMMEKSIRDQIESAIEVQSREKTVAEDMRARVNVLKDISAAMAQELGREATAAELAERMRMTEEEIRDIMKLTLDAMSVSGA